MSQKGSIKTVFDRVCAYPSPSNFAYQIWLFFVQCRQQTTHIAHPTNKVVLKRKTILKFGPKEDKRLYFRTVRRRVEQMANSYSRPRWTQEVIWFKIYALVVSLPMLRNLLLKTFSKELTKPKRYLANVCFSIAISFWIAHESRLGGGLIAQSPSRDANVVISTNVT